MTPGQRIRAIQMEERKITIDKIDEMPPLLAVEVMDLFLRVQACINQYVNEKDKPLDFRVGPVALALHLNETQRVSTRLQEEGLIVLVVEGE